MHAMHARADPGYRAAVASDLDLNLLRILEAVLVDGNVTRAAERLHLSQPAVSHALARARRALGDPLVVREGQRMVLTAEGRRLAVEIPAIMDRIRAQVIGDVADREHTIRTFVIAAPDVIGGMVAARLHRRLAAAMPEASLEVRRLAADTGADLVDGRVDVAISAPGSWVEPLRSALLAPIRWAPVVGSGHPLAGRKVSLAELSEVPHVDIPGHFVSELVEAALASIGRHRTVTVTVMHTPAMVELVAAADLVGFYPTSLELDPRLRWVRLRDEVLTSSYRLWWGHRADSDPLVTWLRRQLATLAPALRG